TLFTVAKIQISNELAKSSAVFPMTFYVFDVIFPTTFCRSHTFFQRINTTSSHFFQRMTNASFPNCICVKKIPDITFHIVDSEALISYFPTARPPNRQSERRADL
ncbi:MAG: hypothetical protein J6W04_03545, partial [Bacteroidales bacterium]|nr:hypothetical protein [Bacteroidales bacterium]